MMKREASSKDPSVHMEPHLAMYIASGSACDSPKVDNAYYLPACSCSPIVAVVRE